jgi:histidyl-tRNA synthetase
MKIQTVRGTRDFYPEDMAFRQWLADRWRQASRRAGFVEVDGPELEPLELYTEKSGPEIAEQLYWLEDKSGRKLALRPEFTPTLARMISARQASLAVSATSGHRRGACASSSSGTSTSWALRARLPTPSASPLRSTWCEAWA